MKTLLIILGIIAIIVGLIILLLSLGVIPGTGLAGHKKWLGVGAVVAAIGVILVIFSGKKKR